MSRHNSASAAKCSGVSDRPAIIVCRGCCCGTGAKHPGIDHAGQLHQLRDEASGVAQIRTSRCLDACEHSNIVVVAPSSAGRAAGAQAVWLQHVLDDEAITDIATWVRDGGPGVLAPPTTLDLYTFKPSRRVRSSAQ